MNVTTVGIDLAKNLFQVHGVDKHGKPILRKQLAEIPGIGLITASALVASIGDASCFSCGRQLAAWIGLVPRQHSSGGKSTLLGISKHGDSYLRTLLIHGARAVRHYAVTKPKPSSEWVMKVQQRRNLNIAAVALANKNARIVWALLVHGRKYQADYTPAMASA